MSTTYHFSKSDLISRSVVFGIFCFDLFFSLFFIVNFSICLIHRDWDLNRKRRKVVSQLLLFGLLLTLQLWGTAHAQQGKSSLVFSSSSIFSSKITRKCLSSIQLRLKRCFIVPPASYKRVSFGKKDRVAPTRNAVKDFHDELAFDRR